MLYFIHPIAMPYLHIRTNQSLEASQGEKLLQKASKICAETLGKPEDFMMVSLEESRPMTMGGDSTAAAFLDLRSIGLPEGAQKELSAKLCHLMGESINLPTDRVYLNFQSIGREDWGWNGKTFAG